MEIYRAIRDYDNYEVSNLGHVKNVSTGRILRSCKNKHDYYYVNLCSDGKAITKAVHKLVSEAFLPNPNGYDYVDHKNNDKSDNTVDNLRFCTPQQNCHNKKLAINNTSGCKGVHFNKKCKRYQASININVKACHLGYFMNLLDAKRARTTRARAVFGEFLNACEA